MDDRDKFEKWPKVLWPSSWLPSLVPHLRHDIRPEINIFAWHVTNALRLQSETLAYACENGRRETMWGIEDDWRRPHTADSRKFQDSRRSDIRF